MRCSEFLERYSDYCDGLIGDARLRRRLSQHLLGCSRCMRYHARVSRGVTAFRSLSDLEPSPVFRRELARRLATPALVVDEPVVPASASIMVTLMLLAAVALFIWEGLTRLATDQADASPTPSRPLPVAVANPSVPFVSFADLTVPAFGGQLHTPGAEEEPFRTYTIASP